MRLTKPSGELNSPNYPNAYPNAYLNSWTLNNTQGTLKISFMDFKTELDYDTVTITIHRCRRSNTSQLTFRTHYSFSNQNQLLKGSHQFQYWRWWPEFWMEVKMGSVGSCVWQRKRGVLWLLYKIVWLNKCLIQYNKPRFWIGFEIKLFAIPAFCTAKSSNFLACLTINVSTTHPTHQHSLNLNFQSQYQSPGSSKSKSNKRIWSLGSPPIGQNILPPDWSSQGASWLVNLQHPISQPTDLRIKIRQK